MRIIDTHTHIYQPDFDGDIDDVINRARHAGVEKILLPNIDVATIPKVDALAERYPGYCFPMMGLHPTDVTENWESDLEIIKEQFSRKKYVGIGEVGIDLYWDKTFERQQKQAFEEQLCWSIEYDLPVSIHSRNAIMECVECICHVGKEKLRGVFHSFGGNEEELKVVLSLSSFYIGINGTVTFKNSTLPEILLKNVDLSQIIVETDAPYLSPMPYRGKRNEPSYTSYVAAKLGDIYGISPDEAGEITTRNAENLFKI